jgi:DNA-directed RNA polymerase specialized sigma24 family protein
MHQGPDEFDAFYKAARGRLLVQTYALTGDLPASRSAVRDAFVAAWHHWRKVSRRPDPESWVRPHAWAHAQRRHTARIWHRDKTLDPDARATLDALAKLNLTQRKVLLLTQLSASSMQDIAREVGLTLEAAERELQTATSRFAQLRDVPSTSVRTHLQQLTRRVEDARFPRPSIIRRAGATRRRAHTGTGVAAAVAAMLLGGAVVHESGGVSPALHGAPATGASTFQNAAAPTLRVDDLLSPDQVARLSSTRTVKEGDTGDNTDGDGLNTICQQDRFADPRGSGALVRTYDISGKPAMSAVETVELSDSDGAAHRAFARTVGWYTGCQDQRVQLLSTHALSGTADEGRMLVLRDWDSPVTTYTVGIARTGSIVTQTVRQVQSAETPSLSPMLELMGTAVWSICDHPSAGACSTRPAARPVAPPPASDAHGLLQVVDLPPAQGVDKPWVATEPMVPKVNTAATRCDRANFLDPKIGYATTRSFLVPQARLPRQFGLTETLGRFSSPKAARGFFDGIRGRMNSCDDKDLTTRVARIHGTHTADEDLSIWSATVEVSDKQKVTYFMALGRKDDVVVQVGFVPVPGHGLGGGDFTALAQRAVERISNLPRKG